MPQWERVGSSNAVRLAQGCFGLYRWGFAPGLDGRFHLMAAYDQGHRRSRV